MNRADPADTIIEEDVSVRPRRFGVHAGSFPPRFWRSAATTSRTLASDLIAGVTVGLVALPLAMAFAISSGMTPQAGIYCAIVTGFIISALGGSTVQIGGPTGAFVVVVVGHHRHATAWTACSCAR